MLAVRGRGEKTQGQNKNGFQWFFSCANRYTVTFISFITAQMNHFKITKNKPVDLDNVLLLLLGENLASPNCQLFRNFYSSAKDKKDRMVLQRR